MASVGVDFCKFLKANASIAAKVGRAVFHRHVPQSAPERFIYLKRTSFRHERHLEQTGDPAFSHTFAVEVIAENEEEADELADLIRGLDGTSGTFGGRTIQGMFVDDQDDDYEPMQIGSDLGWHKPIFSVEVVP